MTNPATEKQWRITATVDTALCVGDSGGGETGADRTTVKTSDGKLYIPASTVKGIWRHACEVIAQSQDHFVCRSPRAENMCPRPPEEYQETGAKSVKDGHCVICQIFGSPKMVSSIFINDLTTDTELVAESTEIRNGVTINRQRRVAEYQRLYFTETSLSNAGIVFSGDVTINAEITDEQIELLRAGLKFIHAIGTGKSRGLGWLELEIRREDSSPVHREVASITPDPEGDFTELAIEVTLQSPVVLGGRKPTGQVIETVQQIRGGLLRGAVANAWLTASNGQPDADFKRLFLGESAGIFRNCYPGTKVLPATAIGCKDFGGFPTVDDPDKHGIFDTLFKRLIAERTDRLYDPKCPRCDAGEGRVEAQKGFYTQSNGSCEKRAVNTRLLTRVAINRKCKVAADELLYNLNAVDPLSTKGEKIRLYGSARVPSAIMDKVADTLQKEVQRLGGGSSRGLGQVCVKVENRVDTDSLERRVCDFNEALKNVWETDSCPPNTNAEVLDGTYFSIALQSDAILEENWQRSMVLTAPMLQEAADCAAEVVLIRSFASYDYVSGWNTAWGLPKEVDLTTCMGSVFVFRTSDIDAWMPALRTLEKIGVGIRREEGFGQILICDPFHLRTHGHIKLVNEEELK